MCIFQQCITFKMLPKDLSKFSVSDIETGFNSLQSENNQRLKPLRQLLSEGKKLSPADERFMDYAGNLIDEALVLRKIQAEGSVSEAASHFNNDELKRLELLLLKFDQTKTAVIPRESSKL